MAYTQDLKSCGRKAVLVRVQPRAPVAAAAREGSVAGPAGSAAFKVSCPPDEFPRMTALLSFRNLSIARGDRILLRDLEGAVAPGEILRIAAQYDAGLIVMAESGHTTLERLVLGSVCKSVIRSAPCPVLVHRETEGQAAQRAAA